jgi:hypothetical protein
VKAPDEHFYLRLAHVRHKKTGGLVELRVKMESVRMVQGLGLSTTGTGRMLDCTGTSRTEQSVPCAIARRIQARAAAGFRGTTGGGRHSSSARRHWAASRRSEFHCATGSVPARFLCWLGSCSCLKALAQMSGFPLQKNDTWQQVQREFGVRRARDGAMQDKRRLTSPRQRALTHQSSNLPAAA